MMLLLALVWLWGAHGAPQSVSDEDAVRAVVQEYYAAEEREDADRILALWRATAADRPTREVLATVFGAGDDRYTITIPAVRVTAGEAKVRVSADRERTALHNGAPVVIRTTALTAFDLVRESDGWKITSERPLSEEIADALLAASPVEREQMFANPDNVTVSVLHALENRGSRLAMGQQYSAAQGVLDVALAAARAAHDRQSESATLQNLANALYFQREFDKAAAYYQQRLGLARETQDEPGVVSALLGIATTHYARGEYTLALGFYQEALSMFERLGPPASMASTLISIGNVQFMQAEYDASTGSYRRALTLLEGSADSGAISMARSGLGRVFTAQGDLAAALQMYTTVLEDARAQLAANGTRGPDIAATLESIGELQFRLGNVDQARSAFDEARRSSDARHDLVRAGRLLGNLGLTELLAGKFDEALADYVESRRRFEAVRQPEGVGRAWVGVGFSQAAREKFPDAVTAYKTAIALFEREQLDEENCRAFLGLSLAQSGGGDHTVALESARRSRAIADAASKDELKWRARVREGEALRALSRLDEAQRSFEDAIAVIRSQATTAATSAETRSQLDESATAWSGLALTLAQRADAAGALVAEEQRRAYLRQLSLASFESDIVRGSSPADQDQERQTMRELISARAQLRAELSGRNPDAARLKQLQQRVTALGKTRADQQAALYTRVPDLALWRGRQSLPEASDLEDLVPAGTLTIELLVTDDEVLVLSAAHGDAALDVAAAIVPVKRHELEAVIARALEPESLREPTVWRTRSAPLIDLLVKPLATRLPGHDRIVLLPDDVLWKVPFEALAVGGDDLASRASVTYATSLTALAMQRRNTDQRAPGVRPQSAAADAALGSDPNQRKSLNGGQTPRRPLFGAVAGTALAADLRAQLTIAAPGWTPPDTADGVGVSKTLAALYQDDSKVVIGADATKAAARDLMNATDVLHISAPLQMNAANPLFSSVLLSPGAGDDSGRWALREWFVNPGHARVLSLPDGSAFGGTRVGAAMDALAWAAAAEGVSTLVIGRWPPDGFASDAVLASVHEGLATSAPPAEALDAAIAAARAKNGDAPSNWAGLRLIGDGR